MELSPSDKGRIEHQFDRFLQTGSCVRNERLQKNDFKKNGKRDFIF